MSIFRKITNLFAKKQKIDKEITNLQKSCKHINKSVKPVRERVDSSTIVIRWVCDECLKIVGFPNSQDEEKYFKE
tara:strand:- start:1147 stop:1371 length:225 start_codon:yes stop_codon:yes gene_type:complete